jgi:mRNA-degrading endonuclease YafQ of YafQ-DinJ toxin-antitoxin module
MNWTLFRTKTFLRTSRIFFRKHPELLPEFGVLILQLADDPFVPRIRPHPLQGRHRGKRAVSLAYEVRLILTVIEDDGIGFDPILTLHSSRLGLVGMRVRADMLGGKLIVESSEGKGTTVVAEVPDANPDTAR